MKKILHATLCSFALLLSGAAVAQTVNQATLSWTPPATYSDGTAIAPASLTFGVYQGIGPGTAKTKIGTATFGEAGAFVVNSGLALGNNYCWQVTSIVGSQESVPSNEACKNFPFPAPPAPASLQAK